jgi:hypothetical protein
MMGMLPCSRFKAGFTNKRIVVGKARYTTKRVSVSVLEDGPRINRVQRTLLGWGMWSVSWQMKGRRKEMRD